MNAEVRNELGFVRKWSRRISKVSCDDRVWTRPSCYRVPFIPPKAPTSANVIQTLTKRVRIITRGRMDGEGHQIITPPDGGWMHCQEGAWE